MKKSFVLVVIALLLSAEALPQEKKSDKSVEEIVGLPLSEFVTFTFKEGKVTAASLDENGLIRLPKDKIKVSYDLNVPGRGYDVRRGLDQFLKLVVDIKENFKFMYEQEKPSALSVRVSKSAARTKIIVEDDSRNVFVRFIQKKDGRVELLAIDGDTAKRWSADDFVCFQLKYPDVFQKYFVSILKRCSLQPPFSLSDKDVISMALSGLDPLPKKEKEKLDSLIKQLDDESYKKRVEAKEALTSMGIHALRALEKVLKKENTSAEVRVTAKRLVKALAKHRDIEQYVKSVQLNKNLEYLIVLMDHENKEVRARAHEKMATAAEKYLTALPSPGKRTEEQREQAGKVKILLAHSKYATGDYKAAAELFDALRRTVRCPKCGYEEILELQDFDKPLRACPKCKKEEVKLEKANDSLLEIVEGAAKSYLAIYEELDKTDMVSLNRAQDIYQRMFRRLDPVKQQDKYWEVVYTILKIWHYKGGYRRIVGELDNLEEYTEDDWRRMIPVKRWRDKIRELYKKAAEALKEDK